MQSQQPLIRPRQMYYIMNKPLQKTIFTIDRQSEHVGHNKRAIIAFKTRDHASFFRRLYTEMEFKGKYKNKKAKTIAITSIDVDDLISHCRDSSLDAVLFQGSGDYYLFISSDEPSNKKREIFEQLFQQ